MSTYCLNFAEREGFEPPVPLSTPVFKTGVIDHSTIFPSVVINLTGANLQTSFKLCKQNNIFLEKNDLMSSFSDATESCIFRLVDNFLSDFSH